MRAWIVAGLLAACTGQPPAEEAREPWPGEDERPALDHPLFEAHDFGALSLCAEHVSGPADERPDAAHRGPYGVGNGRFFALFGLADPVSRLHSAIGPVYRRSSRFFGDQWFEVEVDGEPAATPDEWIARPRGTSLVVTRADTADVSIYTVDLAPMPAGVARQDVPPMLVRFLAVTSRSDATTPDAWLDDTLAWWHDGSAKGVQLHASDPRVDDLYDGMRTAIRVQTAAHGGVSPMSRYTGVWLGDYVARFRPWEGGIVLDAMLSYLLGATPTDEGLSLRPHLPDSLDRLDADGLLAGGATGSLSLSRCDRCTVARFTSTADVPFELSVELPLPAGGRPPSSSGDDSDAVVRPLPAGEWVLCFPARTVAPGQTVSYRMRW